MLSIGRCTSKQSASVPVVYLIPSSYYAHIYNQCVYDALGERLGKDQAALFARSATAGGQRFPIHWGGDCESTYEAMAETLRGGLSLACSGFSFWSHDIGGFEVSYKFDF